VRYLVLRTDDEGIASLTLNRPDALNALRPKPVYGITRALRNNQCPVRTNRLRDFSRCRVILFSR